MTGFIGVVSVTPASGRVRARKWTESRHYKDLDTRLKNAVNCADSKHKIKHN